MNCWNTITCCLLWAQTTSAEAPTRTTFEWGRISEPVDWLLPLAVFALIAAYVWWLYRRDTAEISPVAGLVLALLRTVAFAGLLLIYLQPQWRNEQDVVTPSRAILLVDSSLSMGLHDTDSSPIPAEPNRIQQVASAIAGDELLPQLRTVHDLVIATFDSDVRRLATLDRLPPGTQSDTPSAQADTTDPQAASVDWKAVLEAQGLDTRIGQALRQVIEEEGASPVSGIVVFTDGQQNAGVEATAAAELARQARIPIYPVGIGSDRQPANVRASDLLAPSRAYPGDSYTVTGYVQGQGMIGKTVTVELWSREAGAKDDDALGGKLEGTEQLLLGGDGEIVPVRFTVEPGETGRRTLRLLVKPPPEDRNATDNVQEADIEIVDRKTRVLLFAGGPTREYQFLRNLLKRDSNVIVDVLLQTGSEGVSQDANSVLEEFPTTREELYQYDCIVAFDPDWRELGPSGTELVDRWVADQAGGLIVIPGPVHCDAWAQDASMEKIRALYPVVFHRRFSLLDDARTGSKEPWPLAFTREGTESEFLWTADTSAGNALNWSKFKGVYGFYSVRGPKPGATVYARFSDPRSAEGGELPVYMAGQFVGSGRVFYLGSGELWRLRALDEAWFERLYTQLIRWVSQGRLLRGSTRGVLLVERDRYLLGDTAEVRAQLTDARLEPLTLDTVSLEVVAPDSTLSTVTLEADPTRAGSYRGQFALRKEGIYRLELPVPESSSERLVRRIQVRVPDLERETPQRNDALLNELAQRTGGHYYVGLDGALGKVAGITPLWDMLRDQSRTTTKVARPEPLWDNWYVMLGLCGVLCLEWLIRRLLKLA